MQVDVPAEYQHLYVTNEERPVVKVPSPVLRQRATEVDKVGPKVHKLISEMERIMRQANGIGIAAPQIGVGKRVILIAPDGMRPMALVNPEIVKVEGPSIPGQEGCLSIPGLYGDVSRQLQVVVHALDRKGRAIEMELEGLPARVVQHEIDHLDGVLFIDKVDPATLHWQDPDKNPEDNE